MLVWSFTSIRVESLHLDSRSVLGCPSFFVYLFLFTVFVFLMTDASLEWPLYELWCDLFLYQLYSRNGNVKFVSLSSCTIISHADSVLSHTHGYLFVCTQSKNCQKKNEGIFLVPQLNQCSTFKSCVLFWGWVLFIWMELTSLKYLCFLALCVCYSLSPPHPSVSQNICFFSEWGVAHLLPVQEHMKIVQIS